MLLEAIFKRIKFCSERSLVMDVKELECILGILKDAIPIKHRPEEIIVDWYTDKNKISYKFVNRKANTYRIMDFNELYQYFCTVLGEKE